MKRYIRSLKRTIRKRSNRERWTAIVFVAVAAIGGYTALTLVGAASYAVPAEAEAGNIQGNATATSDSTASGGQSVRFGAANLLAPTRLQALTGGDSIALIWEMPAGNVKNVQVYRNDTLLATVTPAASGFEQERLGTVYFDKPVTVGTTYRYKIRAVNQSNVASAFTPTVSATHPQSNIAIPTVTFDTTKGGADLLPFFEGKVRPLLQHWFPKVIQRMSYPDYVPPAKLHLVMDPSIGVANAPGGPDGIINVNPNWVRDNQQNSAAMFVHEAAHLVGKWPAGDPTTWAVEGLASWSSDFFSLTHRNSYVARPNEPLGQYSAGAFFIDYVTRTYDNNFPYKINTAIRNRTYNASYLASLTGGRSEAQLWTEAKARNNTAISTVRHSGGTCVEAQGGTAVNGTRIQLTGCDSNANPQKWVLSYVDPDKKAVGSGSAFDIHNTGIGGTYCLDVAGSGTADGTRVQLWSCNGTNAQKWLQPTAGVLVNVNSGKCLTTTGGSSAAGTQLVIMSCDGSSGQRWSVPS